MNNPIDSSALWKHLQKFHNENTIVIINADDLRSKGVNISKSLSWERTAQDFVWQINNNPNLAFLASCHHLIIPFGLEGAIYYRNESVPETKLYFYLMNLKVDLLKIIKVKCMGLLPALLQDLQVLLFQESKKMKNYMNQ